MSGVCRNASATHFILKAAAHNIFQQPMMHNKLISANSIKLHSHAEWLGLPKPHTNVVQARS